MSSSLADRPLFTEVIEAVELFRPEPGSTFVSSASNEPRSLHVQDLKGRAPGTRYVEITDQGKDECQAAVGPDLFRLPLTGAKALAAFWAKARSDVATYLDITGLEHQVWAALVASALKADVPVRVVYVEPVKYRRVSMAQAGDDLFDLSVGFAGVSPLPGFASLAEPEDDDFYFLPLLGFEGRRFAYLMSAIAPAGSNVFPVVGVPGFQPEFVGYAYEGNLTPLSEDDAWQRALYATANCPFSLYYVLEDFATKHVGAFFKVAMIGTKPHSLGALLFALARPNEVELVYDHPRRRDKRTEGAARLLIYDIGGLTGLSS